MIGFRPQPSAGGTGGGSGSYDDTAIRKRLSDNEILDGVQNAAIEALEDASVAVTGRLKTLEDAPAPVPFDPAPLNAADAAVAERVAVLEAKPAPAPFDPAPLVAADADLVRRIGVIEGRPDPVPYDDTGLRGRVKALEDVPAPVPFDPAPLIAADVGFDRRLDVVEIAGAQIEDRVDILEKAPAPAPYDDAAIVARVKTLEDAPQPVPFDPAPLVAADTALGERIGAAEIVATQSTDRITALESVPIPPPFDPSTLEAADAALGRRIDTLSAEGYDDTALSGRVKALEDAPAPVPYDDAGLRGRVTDLEARPLHTPFDPAPLAAADADLGRRIGVIEGRPEHVPYDDTHLRGRVTDLEARPVHVPFDPAPLVAADAALADRVATIEATPAPVPYDDAALRGRVADLEARPVPAPFDPAPLEAADKALGDRIDGHDILFGQVRDGMGSHLERLMSHDRALSDHQQRIVDLEGRPVGGGGAPYDDGPLTSRVVALEDRPAPQPFDPSALEAADKALGERIDAIGSGGAKPLVFLGAVRFLTSRTGVTLASLLPAGTTEIEIECIGGGASGKSVYAPSGTSNVVAPGGHPGGVRRSGRIRIGPTLQADILIGAGGARTLSSGNTHGPDNAGGDTTVGLYNGLTVRAEGGPSYADFTNINTGINTTTHSQYLHRLPAPQMPKPGQGHTAGNTAQRASHAADGYDAPTGGGGTVAGGSGSHGAGNGGTVYLLKNLGMHSTSKLPGGLGSTTLSDSSGDGQNHISNQPGTYGPGGGGHYWLNGSQSVSEAGNGAIPGGGGGGGVAVAGANFVQRSGAGAQGAADIYCWGPAQ